MNQFVVEGFFNEKEQYWQAKLPDGQIWGACLTFRDLVQLAGTSISNEMQVIVTHPDPLLGQVIILRGWGNTVVPDMV